jgi:dsRNA-specific ribonuclease
MGRAARSPAYEGFVLGLGSVPQTPPLSQIGAIWAASGWIRIQVRKAKAAKVIARLFISYLQATNNSEFVDPKTKLSSALAQEQEARPK